MPRDLRSENEALEVMRAALREAPRLKSSNPVRIPRRGVSWVDWVVFIAGVAFWGAFGVALFIGILQRILAS